MEYTTLRAAGRLNTQPWVLEGDPTPTLSTMQWWAQWVTLCENAEGKAEHMRSQPLAEIAPLVASGKTLGGRPLPKKVH